MSRPVCLINPPTTDPGETRSYFPMALLALGGVLKKNNIPAQLWDFDLFFKDKGNLLEKDFLRLLKHGIRGLGSKIYCISSICSNFPMAIYLAKQIRHIQPEALILLGGPQPSSVPEETMENFDFIDALVVGEGEVTLQDFVDVGFDREKITKIPGVYSNRNGKVQFVPKRQLADDLDMLPMPDYSLIHFSDYVRQRPLQFLASLEVGRGCPFHCTFCSTSVMWERKYRVKSPTRIHQEMRHLKDHYGFDSFEFIHDNFTTSRKFVNDFCSYMERHNKEGFKWYSSSRTDCISIPLMDRMYRAGCRWLFFGIETGSPRMQEIIQKNLNFEKFEPILKHGNKLGIQSVAAFILGFPEETSQDMDQTVYRALHYKEAGTATVFIAKLSPLAGTVIFRDHYSKFKELAFASTLSPQNYGLPEVVSMIMDHPQLFSSFYHVPHPEFSLEYLTKFIEFSHYLVNGDSGLNLKVLDKFNESATELFKYWAPWAKQKNIGYYNFRTYSEGHFRRDFLKFLADIGVSIKKRLPNLDLSKFFPYPKKIASGALANTEN